MLHLTHDSTAVGTWLVAVTGALAILVGPITPWFGVVELVGGAAFLAGTATLLVWFFRH